MASGTGRPGEERGPGAEGQAIPPVGAPAIRPERHLRVGVSHPSNDPARHRTFDVRASYREGVGWVAHVAEENRNEQLGPDAAAPPGPGHAAPFPTAAACLAHAVSVLVRMVDGDAAAASETAPI